MDIFSLARTKFDVSFVPKPAPLCIKSLWLLIQSCSNLPRNRLVIGCIIHTQNQKSWDLQRSGYIHKLDRLLANVLECSSFIPHSTISRSVLDKHAEVV